VAAWTVFRPVATLMIVVAVAVFGYISYEQLPVSLMPELSYPTLTIRTELQGAAPQEVEENVTERIEEIVRTVEGVVGLESTSRAGQSDVVLRFGWNTDMDYAMQKVRERVELIPLPDEAETPLLLRYDPALDPILRLGVSGDADLTELRRYADEEIQRSLEKVEGVAMIKVRGGEEEVVRVDLDPGRMAFLGVSAAEVAQRLAAENVNLAGGALADGDVTYLVRTLNAFEDVDEIRDLIVAYPDGVPVRLHQIGTVFRDVRDPEVITRMGSPGGVSDSVVVEVFKEADANLVEVSERVRHTVYGSEETLTNRARDLAQDRAARVTNRAKLTALGQTNIASGRPLPRSPIVVDRLPDDVEITVLGDQAIFIRNSIDEVRDTALWGGLFAVLVLILFLRNTWTTVIIAIAIPLSVVSAFGALRLAGVSLNVMSLGGIALGVGMLVDNSIVVLESIFRCREEGDASVEAALRGTREVAGAVVASTLTTIAVFFPIVFVEGVAGQIFGDLALSVVFALLASLAVAVFFVPMLASRRPVRLRSLDRDSAVEQLGLTSPLRSWMSAREDWSSWSGALRDSTGAGRTLRLLMTPVVAAFIVARTAALLALEVVFGRILLAIMALVVAVLAGAALGARRVLGVVFGAVFAGFDVVWNRVTGVYPRLLRRALDVTALVLAVALGAFGWSLYQFDALGTELLPQLHQGEFTVRVAMPVGTRLEETSEAIRRLEKDLVDIDGIERFSTTVGIEATEVQASDEGEHTARIAVRLGESDEPAELERSVMADVRRAAADLPGAATEIERPTLFTLQTPLEVQVFSDDLRLLRIASDAVESELRSLGTLADVRNNLGRGFPEVRVVFDRDRLAAYDLSARQVGEAIRDQVRGLEPTDIREVDETIDIVVRTAPEEIPDVDALENLIVRARTGDEPEIRLGGVANLELAVGPSEIRHVEGRRAAVIEADVPLVSLSQAAEAVDRRLGEAQLPGGVVASVAGQNVEMQRAIESLTFALMLAIFLVYIVLASKFESFRGPFVILLSIPLALVGVVAALSLLGIPVNVLVFIGLIMLAGIVVNNAIVLVDYINQLRDRGQSMTEAIVNASEIRLRPVLITTLTTVLGLTPMALGLGEGAELRQPMGITVIAGLVSATLLTLVVVPVLYRVLMASFRSQAEPAE
jgi:HAE1 family hydrophobic/amphiphilic exporter-1